MNLDFFIFQQINQFAGQNAYLDMVGIFFAKYFGYFLIFLLFFFLYKNFNKYLRMVCLAILATLVSRLFFTELIRFIIPRDRPYVENNVNLILAHVAQPSFPSGHAAFFFAFSTIIYLYNMNYHTASHNNNSFSEARPSSAKATEGCSLRHSISSLRDKIFWRRRTKKYPHLKFFNVGIGLWFFAASSIICLSRVFCGIHWPLDILAGAIVGIFSGLLIYKLLARR